MKLFARALAGTIMAAGSITIGSLNLPPVLMSIVIGIWAWTVFQGVTSIMEVTE